MTATRLQGNKILIHERERRRWSHLRAAAELKQAGAQLGIALGEVKSVQRQLMRIESGATAYPGEDYRRAICAAYRRSAAELFGADEAPLQASTDAPLAVASHQFSPSYLGPQAVRAIAEGCDATPVHCGWMPCDQVDLSNGRQLYLFPFGVAVVHVVDALAPANLAEVAVWRRDIYPQTMRWAGQQLDSLLTSAGCAVDSPLDPHYVLSAYWVERTAWTGDQLQTAMRILSRPSVLLERDTSTPAEMATASAALVERRRMADGFDDPKLVEFGCAGVSVGCATWSGVAYHPVAPRRALVEAELVSFEILLQAVWCYSHYVTDATERAVLEGAPGPTIDERYGCRFLRACTSRFSSAAPQETGQYRDMREAIYATSSLPQLLDAAQGALRESQLVRP
jgi:hypothetical protein